MKKVVLLCLFVAGCGNELCRPDPVTKVPPPADLTIECEKLEPWKDPSFGSILEHDTKLMTQYTECRLRHKKLSEAIQKQQ